MTKKTKLELTWPGKEDRPRLEPRILIEDTAKSHHAAVRRDGDHFDNILLKGDNLLALKALEREYAGKVKCVFIDPPYNTGSAFEHYDDGVEHSIWLSLMRDRLEIIHQLLSTDGSLWVALDDNEAHYFKVMCDEVFGRSNFVCDIAWEKRYSPPPDTKDIGYVHDHVFVYRKTRSFSRNLLPITEDQSGRYKNPDDDSRGPWKSMDYTCRYTAEERPNLYYPIIQPNTGEEIWPKRTRVWAFSQEAHRVNEIEHRLWWGKGGKNSVPALKNFITSINQGMMPMSLWKHTLAGHNQDGRKETLALIPQDPFDNPKPEKLLQTILTISTNPGDLVLDSFAGSGTTGAVAHKMGRRWIMTEIGDHAETHIVPRLQKVIDGTDQGGISKAVDWQGGGGFRFFTLAPSLLARDHWGNLVIAADYNPAMLAEAMCKHLGFTYAPATDELHWWQHGRSSETDFIYVTTQSLTHDALKLVSEAVGPGRTLMICARAFAGAADGFDNLTCRKIPSTILTKCEWGRDDYSLNVAALPEVAPDDEADRDEGPLFAAPVETDRG